MRVFICLVASLVVASVAVAQVGRPAGVRRVVRRTQPTTVQLLNQRVPEITFQEQPLEQVMEWLTDYTGMNVSVRWQMLEDNGIERDKPISIKARNLRLSQILWMIMNEAGGSDIKLAYRASGNLIILSTHEDLGKDMITRVYDVGDLLLRIPRFTNAAQLNPSDALNQAGQGGGSGGGGGGGGGNLFEDNEDNDNDDQQDSTNDMQALVDIITGTIEPDTWNINGGQGAILTLRRQIIVRNSILVHQLLGGPIEG